MRRRPGLGLGVGAGRQPVRRDVVPRDTTLLQARCLDSRALRGVERAAGMGQIAGRTAAIMRGTLAGVIALAGVRSAALMTDRRRTQRIRGKGGRPAGGDRCKNLHHQCHQHDRKEFPQPPAHRQDNPLQRAQLIMLRVGCRDWVPEKTVWAPGPGWTISAAGCHGACADRHPAGRPYRCTRQAGARKIITRRR
jgi:hypothetical protein